MYTAERMPYIPASGAPFCLKEGKSRMPIMDKIAPATKIKIIHCEDIVIGKIKISAKSPIPIFRVMEEKP
jgi:hypothetical protein